MTWLRIDDAMVDHPKIAPLGDRAFRVHVAGLSYCARQLTDGFVPRSVAKAHLRATKVALHELEIAGLWRPTPVGWVINDYLDYNPSKEKVLAERESRRQRASLGGQAKAAKAVLTGSHQAGTKQASSTANDSAPLPQPPFGFKNHVVEGQEGEVDHEYDPLGRLLAQCPDVNEWTHGRAKQIVATRGLSQAHLERIREELHRPGIRSPAGYVIKRLRNISLQEPA